MERIRILGVGWQEDDLTLGAIKALRAADMIVLRTGQSGCGEWLTNEGIAFETLDDLFEKCEDFDELIVASAQRILNMAAKSTVLYCVNDLSDKTVARLLESADSIELIPGVSEGSRLIPFASDELRVISASDADVFKPDAHTSTLIRELSTPLLAGEIKLKLTECYPDEMTIYICEADRSIHSIQLCDLDRQDTYDHRLCALVPAVHDLRQLERYDMRHLVEIIRKLRDYDGCPWDREQTHKTLRSCLIEEAYETVDAINREEADDLYSELGDVLFQVIFHSEIGRQYGEFDLSDVTTAICRKMIRRHPHVFGRVPIDESEATEKLWHEMKKQENAGKDSLEIVEDIADTLPALMRAEKVCRYFRQDSIKLPEMRKSFDDCLENPNEHTIGRLLMAIVAMADGVGVQSELALNEYISDYIRRLEEAK